MKNKKQNYKILLSIPFVSMFIIFLFYLTNIFSNFELKSIDLRFKIRGEQDLSHSDIILVTIDEQSYGSLKEKYPYPRSYYAKLVDNLTEVGARQIIFDIEFTKNDEENEIADQEFAQSIKKSHNVILCGTIIRNLQKNYNYYQPPIEVLRENTVANGLINDTHDDDGFVRKYNIFIPCQNHNYFTIGILGYALENEISPNNLSFFKDKSICIIYDTLTNVSTKIKTVRNKFWHEQSFYINYYGPANSFPYYSISQVLDDANFDLLEERDSDYMEIWKKNSQFPDFLRINFLTTENQKLAEKHMNDSKKLEEIIQRENPFFNKIVFVGSSLPELHDERYTPFYHYKNVNRLMPGVEIHAHALQTLIDKNYLTKTSVLLNILIFLSLNFVIVFIVEKYRPVIGGILSLIMIAIILFSSILLFGKFNLIIPLVSLITSVIFCYFGVVIVDFFNEERERRKIRKMFQTYTSTKVLKYLEENPESFSLKGERREATIFFSDIAGFTTISEKLSAEQMSALLNKYLTPMTHILMKYDGYVDKYIGDAIMCNFGVPIVNNDHPWQACFSALEQFETLDKLNKEFFAEFGFEINIRIGINTGIVNAGNMGSDERFQYSVIGDVVNQAARFESANKNYGTKIMIGEDTYNQVKDKIAARLLDKIVVKGKVKSVKVYNLLGLKKTASEDLINFIKYYNSGMEKYFNRDWNEAIEQFSKAKNIFPDKASEVMIIRSKEYMENPPSDTWSGEYIFQSK